MKKYIIPIAIFALAVLVGFNYPKTEASVTVGSTYGSTVFAPAQTNTSYKQSYVIDSIQPATTSTARPFGGTLGSVIITGAAAGTFTIYDATTSNVTLRVGATTTLPVLASFPASAAAGTYTFDTSYRYGLVVEFSGAQGTSTITWRPF